MVASTLWGNLEARSRGRWPIRGHAPPLSGAWFLCFFKIEEIIKEARTVVIVTKRSNWKNSMARWICFGEAIEFS